jgi:hypothetical protein
MTYAMLHHRKLPSIIYLSIIYLFIHLFIYAEIERQETELADA